MSTKPTLVYDLEIYQNYFLCAFKNIETGNVRMFEMYEGCEFDIETVRKILRSSTVIGFNSINFDLPILSMALSGADNEKLKKATNAIIENNLRSWQLERRFNFKTVDYVDHIDLIEVAPGMASLKIYGGRMHAPKMQDLPIEPDALISSGDRELLKSYCVNDLVATEMLYCKLSPQIKLRTDMSAEYDIDLRSKSDAQIAEAVIKKEVGDIKGEEVVRPEIDAGTVFKYTPPKYIKFSSVELRDILQRLKDTEFVVQNSGKVEFPAWMTKLKVSIGGASYKMGIGGLHSQESTVSHHTDEQTLLVDRDVASYYPNIILSLGLRPRHMGDAFTKVYSGIVQRRLKAKRDGDKVTNEALKITINGSFGKFGSKWSVLYSPDLLIQTTITGQLALMMLIENLEDAGIQVVSANTDGIVCKLLRSRYSELEDIFFEWETQTRFETEETRYRAIYSRDVNNFVAIKEDGGHKAKGVYAPGSLAKTPSSVVCIDAVLAYLKTGAPVEDTIHSCWDITRFVTVRSVKGGALDQQGAYLGKAIRWYYSTDVKGDITYKINGYKVPRTEGARALMDLPAGGEFPADVDLDWYIAEAKSILNDIGATL
ncbi:MAG: hypothetical protein CGW95_06525 [Phenylobacterium zucineum]|nr:MAG: hypothetical protein CGW95_06525 [Phenylobacterium zucineum]